MAIFPSKYTKDFFDAIIEQSDAKNIKEIWKNQKQKSENFEKQKKYRVKILVDSGIFHDLKSDTLNNPIVRHEMYNVIKRKINNCIGENREIPSLKVHIEDLLFELQDFETIFPETGFYEMEGQNNRVQVSFMKVNNSSDSDGKFNIKWKLYCNPKQ